MKTIGEFFDEKVTKPLVLFEKPGKAFGCLYEIDYIDINACTNNINVRVATTHKQAGYVYRTMYARLANKNEIMRHEKCFGTPHNT